MLTTNTIWLSGDLQIVKAKNLKEAQLKAQEIFKERFAKINELLNGYDTIDADFGQIQIVEI